MIYYFHLPVLRLHHAGLQKCQELSQTILLQFSLSLPVFFPVSLPWENDSSVLAFCLALFLVLLLALLSALLVPWVMVFFLFVLVKAALASVKEGRKEIFYLTTHSTHFIYGYMASDIWLRSILIVRKETRCCHISYSFQLAAYASSHRQDNTYHGLCYTRHGALAGTRNSSMGLASVRKTMIIYTGTVNCNEFTTMNLK